MPCPVCGKPDWCGQTADGAVVRCMRVTSDRPSKKGGWIHRMAEPVAVKVFADPKPKAAPRYNFPMLAGMFTAVTYPDEIEALAGELGVTAASLVALGIGRAKGYPMFMRRWGLERPIVAWSFPMHDAGGNVVGLRMRGDDGSKFAFTDSTSGVFIPQSWRFDGPVVIVEGPTDAAAVLDWGFDAIGRPSCNTGDDIIADILKAFRRDVVILSNLDEAKHAPGGRTFYPGQEGAAALADKIVWRCASLKVITPPGGIKDARAWLRAGGTRQDLREVIASKGQWRPTNKDRQ
jgi:hypothetical protein